MGFSVGVLCFCKQKTAYEMRISDWSSDVCSSDLSMATRTPSLRNCRSFSQLCSRSCISVPSVTSSSSRSEEHTSELQSLMRISYAVFCLKKKKIQKNRKKYTYPNKKRTEHSLSNQQRHTR